jgi:uncharacterized protein (DUF427 family)
VQSDLLEPSHTTTLCPYKGLAHYWTLRLPDVHEKDLVCFYAAPFHAQAVRGLLRFAQERVEMQVSE